ncbi:hypothetical protein QTL97_07690 [Sporosarcina thermotolerans]|uniref:ABC transporter permease n=1 Tax=Sporosarcina thermotolerans TaxID=633404 RepID=A0AAW9A784_9BACL|nr:hypothetical protein [Sporosarcina thermotolerans]MDW0116810.1 hypothetical protein [Sporosarcina thermotolerans]
MNWNYLKHEFLITVRSRRNIPFLLFVGVLLLSYCLVLLPNANTKEAFDKKGTEKYLVNLEIQQKLREQIGNTGVVLHSGIPVYAWNDYNYGLFKGMLSAYTEGNYTRLLKLRTFYLEGNKDEYVNDKALFKVSPFPGKDREHLYHQTMIQYEDYITKGVPITFGIMYEKTGLQALQNFLQGFGVYFLLFCTIYFSSDILSRDRKHRTLLQGIPLSWYRQLNLKSLSAFLYSMLFIAGVVVIGVLIMSWQYGFGYFDLRVPTMIAQQTFKIQDYSFITIASYLGKTLAVLPLLLLIFVRLNVIFSLLLKNEWFVLMFSTVVLFSERLYFSRTTRELFGLDISLFPQTYFDFGKIVDAEKNYLVNTETITYAKGIIALLSLLIIIEVILFLVSRLVNKRRYYKFG